MAATIKFKRGSSDSTGTLAAGEPAFNTSASKFFIGTDGTNKTWVGAEIENTVTWSSASATKLATQAAIATYYPSQVTATAPNTGTLYPIFGNSSSAGAVAVSVDSGISYNASTDALTLAGDLALNGGDLTSTSSTFNFLTNAVNPVGTLNLGPSAKTMVINIGGMEFFKYQDGSAAGRKLFASDTGAAGIEKVHIYGGYAGSDAVVTREVYINSDVAVSGDSCTFNTYLGSGNTTASGSPTSNVNIGTNNGLGTINLYAADTVASGDLAVNGGAITSNQTTFDLVNGTVTDLNIGGNATAIAIGKSSTANATTTIHSVPIGIGGSSATRRISCTSVNSGGETTQIVSGMTNAVAETNTLDLQSALVWNSGTTARSLTVNIGAGNTHTGANITNTINVGTSTALGSINLSQNTDIKGGKELRFSDSDNTQYVAFKAPATGDLTANTTYTLPSTIGAAGTVLKIKTGATSSAAELEWSSAATATSVTVADNTDNNERNILFTDATAAGTADVKIDVTGGNLDVGIQYNPSLNRLSTGSYRLQSGSSSHWLSLAASASQTGSYTLTLPVDGGTADYVLKTNGSGGTSWTNTIAQTNTVKVVESVDNDSTILRMVGVASSTTDQYQEIRMDSDGLEYRPKINRFTIKGDTGGDLGWNTGGTSVGQQGGKTGGGATQGGSWGVGQLEFMSVDGTAGNAAGATRFAVNAAQTDFVTYVLPEAAGSQGQVLRISTSTSTTDVNGDPVYYLEWGAGATADLATDVAGGAAGDLLYQQGNNDTAFLTIGANGTVLTSSGSAPQWTASSGTGNIARVDGATFGAGSTWNGSAIGAVYGGTGQTTYATGDILYASASNTLSKLTKPSNTSVLQMTGSGVPSWVDTLTVAEGGTGTTSGSITGTGALTYTSGSGTAVTLTSAGGNSNINLTPTGTGTVAIGGSGRITGLADLTSSSPGSDAANKNYVDAVAQGLHVHASVKLATTGALTNSPNYSNGTNGQGATLTATTNGALSIDGVAVALNDRVLVKNQSSALQNGIYDVTATGGASATYTLTRSTDFDSAGEIDGGDFLFVTAGNTLASTGWVQTTSGVVVGTNNIVFTQFSGAGTYSASNGVRLSGTTFGLQGAGSNFLTLSANGAIYATSSTELASGTLPLNAGGTGKALTATNGGIVWSDADSLEITSAGTSGQILVSAGAAAPVWTTASDITTGKADTVKQTLTTAAATYYLTFTDNNTNAAYEDIRVNSNLTYNPNQASYSLGSTSVSDVAVMTVGSSGTGYVDAIVDGGTY